MKHTPVLLKEVIKYLEPKPNENFVDATFGDGGHALEILKRTSPNGRLLGIDWDKSIKGFSPRFHSGQTEWFGLDTGLANLKESEPLLGQSGIEPEPFPSTGSTPSTSSGQARSPQAGSGQAHSIYSGQAPSKTFGVNQRLILECGNFADIAEIYKLWKSDFHSGVDGVLFDFGFRSYHIDESGRGFSYSKEEPLDMRYNPLTSLTAAEIINSWKENDLARIFKEFGEERNAKRIAKNILETRKIKRIITTTELVRAVGSSDVKTLSRIFQALRIEVNHELENIKQGLAGAWEILKPGGRLVAISFHSLEDRLVKNFFSRFAKATQDENEKKKDAVGYILTKKPVVATDEEVRENARSRSAKLRAIKKL